MRSNGRRWDFSFLAVLLLSLKCADGRGKTEHRSDSRCEPPGFIKSSFYSKLVRLFYVFFDILLNYEALELTRPLFFENFSPLGSASRAQQAHVQRHTSHAQLIRNEAFMLLCLIGGCFICGVVRTRLWSALQCSCSRCMFHYSRARASECILMHDSLLDVLV